MLDRTIDRLLEEGICERGNYAFSNEEGSAVLFTQIGEDYWLQAAYTPMNYPSWDVSSFYLVEEDLVNHITYTLGGWHIDKTQCDLNDSDGCIVPAEDVVDDVANHVMNMAAKYGWGFDPTTSLETHDVIKQSAEMLSYLMTERMISEVEDIILEK
jgi:hypothetical protein